MCQGEPIGAAEFELGCDCCIKSVFEDLDFFFKNLESWRLTGIGLLELWL